MEHIGTFRVTKGEIRVTDPCYTPDTWCAGTFKAKDGKWHARFERVDGYVGSLLISHEMAGDVKAEEMLEHDLGVDSGQLGFFDSARYPTSAEQFTYESHTFYGHCCGVTSPNGIVDEDMGVVSMTYCGDGSFRCYVGRNEDGEIVIARVPFVADEEEDEEEHDGAVDDVDIEEEDA